jgi:hypothetical protein
MRLSRFPSTVRACAGFDSPARNSLLFFTFCFASHESSQARGENFRRVRWVFKHLLYRYRHVCLVYVLMLPSMGPIFEKDIFLGPQTHHIEVEKSKKEYETQELVSTLFSYSINPKKQKARPSLGLRKPSYAEGFTHKLAAVLRAHNLSSCTLVQGNRGGPRGPPTLSRGTALIASQLLADSHG